MDDKPVQKSLQDQLLKQALANQYKLDEILRCKSGDGPKPTLNRNIMPEPHAKQEYEQEGQWTVSSDEELWPFDYMFETEAAAIESIAEHCEENCIETGAAVWVGQATGVRVTEKFLASRIDDLCTDVDESISSDANHDESLILGDQKELCGIIAEWFNRKGNMLPWYTLTKVTEHVAPATAAEDSTPT